MPRSRRSPHRNRPRSRPSRTITPPQPMIVGIVTPAARSAVQVTILTITPTERPKRQADPGAHPARAAPHDRPTPDIPPQPMIVEIVTSTAPGAAHVTILTITPPEPTTAPGNPGATATEPAHTSGRQLTRPNPMIVGFVTSAAPGAAHVTILTITPVAGGVGGSPAIRPAGRPVWRGRRRLRRTGPGCPAPCAGSGSVPGPGPRPDRSPRARCRPGPAGTPGAPRPDRRR